MHRVCLQDRRGCTLAVAQLFHHPGINSRSLTSFRLGSLLFLTFTSPVCIPLRTVAFLFCIPGSQTFTMYSHPDSYAVLQAYVGFTWALLGQHSSTRDDYFGDLPWGSRGSIGVSRATLYTQLTLVDHPRPSQVRNLGPILPPCWPTVCRRRPVQQRAVPHPAGRRQKYHREAGWLHPLA
jgi:hypothetical protein